MRALVRSRLREREREQDMANEKTTKTLITPDVARQFLSMNLHNRPLSESVVARLAAAILRGEWMFNGATIVFGADGVLLDGQHRLAAIAASGVACWSLVVTGVDRAAFSVIDSGGKGGRKTADTLSLDGEKHTTALASALAWVDRYYTDTVFEMRVRNPTPQQTQALLRAHPGVRDSVAVFKSAHADRVTGSAVIACHYLFSLVDKQEADRFILDLASGAGLSAGDPVLTARNILMGDRAANAGRSNAARSFALCVKAWNARRAGAKATSGHALRIRMVGANRATTARIDGLPYPEAAE